MITAERLGSLRRCSAGLVLALIIALVPHYGYAHGTVGKRLFIEPLFAEDANVKNELILPRSEFLRLPDGTVRSFGFSLEKQLWQDRWSVSVEQGVGSVHMNRNAISGFDNVEISTKYAAYKNAPHEFILSPTVGVTLPTGSRKFVERHSAVSTGLLWAKGFGDLPGGWLRPLAVQADTLVEEVVSGEHKRTVVYDMVVEYSIPYLNHYIRKADGAYNTDDSLRVGSSVKAILGDMFPFVEFNGETPLNGHNEHTSTFIRPGILHVGHYLQVTAAADIPLRSAPSSPSRSVGAVIMFDFFLDEINHVFKWTPFGKGNTGR
jgi:hypothetical protein